MSSSGMHVMIIGSQGMLGSNFSKFLEGRKITSIDRSNFDFYPSSSVVKLISNLKPNVVINCVADTDVEKAEIDSIVSIQLNAKFPRDIAIASKEVGAKLVHFSSTGCYGNWKQEPYREIDALKPTTVHHRTKAEGEDAVRTLTPTALILRLGWLYGGRRQHKKNFVWKRILDAQSMSELKCDSSQRGCPTFTDDVVCQTVTLLDAGATGTFNCVNEGDPVNRLQYVEAIVRAASLRNRIVAGQFARLAPVSHNEAAYNSRLQLTGMLRMPRWDISLDAYVKHLIISES